MRKITFLLIIIFLLSCETEFHDNICPSLEDCSISDSSTTSATASYTYSTYFSDNFNRADAALSTGANWNTIASGASVDIDTNEVKTDSMGGNAALSFYTTIMPQSDVRVSLDVSITDANFPTTNNAAIILLLRNADNNQVQNSYGCGVDEPTVGSKELIIFRVVAGTATTLVQSGSNLSLANGDSYVFRFQAVGNTLTCTVTGSNNMSVTTTDTNFTSGYVGFGGINQGAEGGGKMDNFVAELIN